MSRKDFVAIAAEFKKLVDSCPSLDFASVEDRVRYNVIKESAEALCRHFINANPRFDRARFLAACGIV